MCVCVGGLLRNRDLPCPTSPLCSACSGGHQLGHLGGLGGLGFLLLRELRMKLEGGTRTHPWLHGEPSAKPHMSCFLSTTRCHPQPSHHCISSHHGWMQRGGRPTAQKASGHVHKPHLDGDPDVLALSPRALCSCGLPDLILASTQEYLSGTEAN